MAEIYKVTTLNINGMSAGGRMRMLNEFMQEQEIDIILLQEVTHTYFDMIHGYTVHLNIGIKKRGTAILTREQITLTNVTRLPSGCGMAANYQGVCFINVYAPSGSANIQEREEFYNVELVYLLRSLPPTMIVWGDFNCVLSQADCTGNMNYSKALHKLVQGLKLTDVWNTNNNRAIYTHYTPHGAARLDRLYVSPSLRNRKMGVQTVMAAFTDHLAVCLRIALDTPLIRGGRGWWKMNIKLMAEVNFRDQLKQEWARWKQQEEKYPKSVTWWESYVKRKIRYMFMTEGKERAQVDTTMENYYYACIYDIL